MSNYATDGIKYKLSLYYRCLIQEEHGLGHGSGVSRKGTLSLLMSGRQWGPGPAVLEDDQWKHGYFRHKSHINPTFYAFSECGDFLMFYCFRRCSDCSFNTEEAGKECPDLLPQRSNRGGWGPLSVSLWIPETVELCTFIVHVFYVCWAVCLRIWQVRCCTIATEERKRRPTNCWQGPCSVGTTTQCLT